MLLPTMVIKKYFNFLLNTDVIDLFKRVAVGAKVVVE